MTSHDAPTTLELAEREALETQAALARVASRTRAAASPQLPAPVTLPAPGAWTTPTVADDNGTNGNGQLRREPKDPFANGFEAYLRNSLYHLILTSQLNILLLCAPVAFWAKFMAWSDASIFLFSLLAIAPFAERLSFVTEQLALHTSEVFGGLLNATFGNVTELIVSLFALLRIPPLLRIVQVSLLGSVLSNLLLVLGTAFLVGGLRHPEQKFNKTASTASFGLLLLATMCVTFPMILDVTHEQIEPTSSLLVSRLTSALMLVVYCLYLTFQLGTHAHIFEDVQVPPVGGEVGGEDDDEDEEEERVLGANGAVFWLAVITFFIAYLSDFLVDAIQGAADDLHVPSLFLGTIVIPIVGNAAEHAAAIIFAYKNKMELSLGIAVGSATQISLFVLPLCVVIGWWKDVPLTMDFHPFETASLLITILLVGVLIQSGESHWLTGIVLFVAYIIIAIGFFFHVDLPTLPPPLLLPPPPPPFLARAR